MLGRPPRLVTTTAPIVVDDTNDVLPALAWATDLSVEDIKIRLDELRSRGCTSQEAFDHFARLAKDKGCTLWIASGDWEPS